MKKTEEIIFEMRSYKMIELRTMLKLNKYYFKKLLDENKEEIGKINGTLLKIDQVRILVLKYGIPYKVRIE